MGLDLSNTGSKIAISVIKTAEYFEELTNSGSLNFYKITFSDDGVDYDANKEQLFESGILLEPSSNDIIKNELIYKDSRDINMIVNPNSFEINLYEINEPVINIPIEVNLLESIDLVDENLIESNEILNEGHVVENNYTDFINIINSSNIILKNNKKINAKYLDVYNNIITKPQRFQTVGNKFNIVVSKNIPEKYKEKNLHLYENGNNIIKIYIYNKQYNVSSEITLIIKV